MSSAERKKRATSTGVDVAPVQCNALFAFFAAGLTSLFSLIPFAALSVPQVRAAQDHAQGGCIDLDG